MATATEAPVGVSNGELVRWAFGKINEHNVEPLKKFWTPETWERFPDKTATGSEAIADYFQSLWRAFPDFRVEMTDGPFVSGNGNSASEAKQRACGVKQRPSAS